MTYPIALTIQPNFGWCERDTGSVRVRELTSQFFYNLDELYTRCPQPQWLPHNKRFNGIVVVEKRKASPHVHIILSCASSLEREGRSTFLLEVADNVTKRRDDPRDEEWQQRTREFISRHPWSSTRPYLPKESLITRFAPKATVMVQINFGAEDARRWAGYMTKYCTYSANTSASRRFTPSNEVHLDWFELREFFKPEPCPPARAWTWGSDGKPTVDLNNITWRVPSRGVLK